MPLPAGAPPTRRHRGASNPPRRPAPARTVRYGAPPRTVRYGAPPEASAERSARADPMSTAIDSLSRSKPRDSARYKRNQNRIPLASIDLQKAIDPPGGSMSARCSYRRPDGTVCKRWASAGSRFCYRHGPAYNLMNRSEGDQLHPLARLTTPDDIFDVVRETLNVTRQGRISPGQAYAVGYLVDIWLRVHNKLEPRQRDTALYRQLLPELIEDEQHAAKKLAHAPPLPDKGDEKEKPLDTGRGEG